MAKEVRIHLTPAQKAKIKSGTGKRPRRDPRVAGRQEPLGKILAQAHGSLRQAGDACSAAVGQAGDARSRSFCQAGDARSAAVGQAGDALAAVSAKPATRAPQLSAKPATRSPQLSAKPATRSPRAFGQAGDARAAAVGQAGDALAPGSLPRLRLATRLGPPSSRGRAKPPRLRRGFSFGDYQKIVRIHLERTLPVRAAYETRRP